MTPTPSPTALPEALLRDTFDRMAARYATWPRSFEEVMADPMRGRLVRITAVRRTKVVCRPAVAPCLAASPGPAAKPSPAFKPTTLDRKRLAAGDRDD